MDKYNVDQQLTEQFVMEQYHKETAQIHAPADLIRRTKEAVREEEQRIAQESAPQITAERTKRSYGRVYKWVLPTAAAAVLCIAILSAGLTGIGGRTNKSASNQLADMAGSATESGSSYMANDGAVDMAAAEAAEAEGTNDMGMLLGEAFAEEEAMEAAGAPIEKNGYMDDAAASAPSDSAAADMQSSQAASDSAMMTNDVQKSDQDEVLVRDADNYAWKIREVEEIPSADDHTAREEHILVQGIDFLVLFSMDDIWSAYATGNDGKLYHIFTEAAADEFSVEEFAYMAYDRLMEVADSAE